MRTLLGMQYGGNVPQQYPRQPIPPQQFQEGGGVSSGLAFLKRGKKRKAAYDEARKTEGRLGRKMGKGRTWGSLLGIGGGLLGAAALGALGIGTGGLGLALAAGLGTAAGKYGGSRLGYGKDLKTKDMMYGEEAGIEDIAEAGESYRGQMSQEALLSGAKAALMAGFAPGGGMYGKAAKFGGRYAPGTYASGVAAEALKSTPGAFVPSAQSDIAGDLPISWGEALDPDIVSAETGALFQPESVDEFGKIVPAMYGDVTVPPIDTSGAFLDTGALPGAEQAYQASLPGATSLGETNELLEAGRISQEALKTARGASQQMDRLLEIAPKYGLGAGELAPEVATEAVDPISSALAPVEFGRWGANRQQYQPLINQFFQQYSPTQRSAENWMSMFNQPEQFAGLMGGGTVQQTPRTLLSLIG